MTYPMPGEGEVLSPGIASITHPLTREDPHMLRANHAHAPALPGPGRAGESVLHAARVRLAGLLLNPRAIPFALAAVTFLAFVPALLNGFVEWDDYKNLFENTSYRGLGWEQIRWMFTSTLMGHYIPVTWLTFSLDYALWGTNPLGYHLTNSLIHAANAALFYLVALRLIAKGTTLTGSALRAGSIMATLFFTLHPLRAESVAWATERRDVLSGLFFLITVLMYLKAAEGEGRRRRRLLVASVACFVLALLSKSIVMTLPLVLVLLDLYPLGRLPLRWGMWREASARTVLKEKLPYLAIGLAGAINPFGVDAEEVFGGDGVAIVPAVELVIGVVLRDAGHGRGVAEGDVVAEDVGDGLDDGLEVELGGVVEGGVVVELKLAGVIVGVKSLGAVVEGEIEADHMARDIAGEAGGVEEEATTFEAAAVASGLGGVGDEAVAPGPAILNGVNARGVDEVVAIIAVTP